MLEMGLDEYIEEIMELVQSASQEKWAEDKEQWMDFIMGLGMRLEEIG